MEYAQFTGTLNTGIPSTVFLPVALRPLPRSFSYHWELISLPGSGLLCYTTDMDKVLSVGLDLSLGLLPKVLALLPGPPRETDPALDFQPLSCAIVAEGVRLPLFFAHEGLIHPKEWAGHRGWKQHF